MEKIKTGDILTLIQNNPNSRYSHRDFKEILYLIVEVIVENNPKRERYSCKAFLRDGTTSNYNVYIRHEIHGQEAELNSRYHVNNLMENLDKLWKDLK